MKVRSIFPIGFSHAVTLPSDWIKENGVKIVTISKGKNNTLVIEALDGGMSKEVKIKKRDKQKEKLKPIKEEPNGREELESDYAKYTYIEELPEPEMGFCDGCEREEKIKWRADCEEGIEYLCYTCGLEVKKYLEG